MNFARHNGVVKFPLAIAAAMLLLCGCGTKPATSMERTPAPAPDPHSYANSNEVRVEHADLDLDVSFDNRQFSGTATLSLKPVGSAMPGKLILDTRDLTVKQVESGDGTRFAPAKFDVGKADKVFGAPLTIQLAPTDKQVRITYTTSPSASGLLWLNPEQTAGKKHPFVFSQGQPIHTRSWVPIQDTPDVRFTYNAHVRTPKELLAVMSAENDPHPKTRGDYRFRMPQAIPSYLMAIAVGDLEFASLGQRSGVYAEPSVVKKAAHELEDTEKMIAAAESLYGPYRWGRYDLLILPPSFPFGGMENPRLTFATPTILAGDKSLVALVSHELAHSWSGNLVTNATWRDFWLNEGFTTYFERRIQEKVYGRERTEMEALIERTEMLEEMKTLAPRDQILYVDLNGRDPDEGFTQIPYVKGMLFLRLLEETYGRERFDAFLRSYFDHYKFQSVHTQDFLRYLDEHLFSQDRALAAKINVKQWIYEPGLPESAPMPKSDLLAKVDGHLKSWLDGKEKLSAIPVKNWSTQEWLHFLQGMPDKLGAERMTELDKAFHLTQTGNAEILNQWLLLAIRNDYKPAMPRLEAFLTEVGRRKFVKPLYTELAKTPEGKEFGRKIYAKAKPSYQSMVQTVVDEVLK